MDNRIRTLGICAFILILSLYVVGIVSHGIIRHFVQTTKSRGKLRYLKLTLALLVLCRTTLRLYARIYFAMHPAIPRLLELQTVDQHIAALRAELDSFPKRLRVADLKLTGARNAVAAAKEAHTSSLKERKKFELDVDQWKERARKYRDQSSAVKTNEAYKALLHEIANAEAEVAKAEDRQLEVMMAGEESERRVRHAEADLKEAEQAITADRKQIEALQAQKKQELAVAEKDRERALAPVPDDLRDLYSRIAKRHHGVALAEARDGQCRGCGMRVLPHTLQQLLRDDNEELFRCESCGLILYSLEPIPATNPQNSSGSTASSASTSS